jgi:hypothetical protein
MTSEVLPLLLATVFTAGGIAIQKAERHAERVGRVLAVVFSIVVGLLIMEGLLQSLPPEDGTALVAERGVDPPKLLGRVQGD